MVRPAVTSPGGRWLRDKERAGPLDTENVRRQGGGETASLLRSKWRLVFGSRAEHGV